MVMKTNGSWQHPNDVARWWLLHGLFSSCTGKLTSTKEPLMVELTHVFFLMLTNRKDLFILISGLCYSHMYFNEP